MSCYVARSAYCDGYGNDIYELIMMKGCGHVGLCFVYSPDYESGGREFESYPVRQLNQRLSRRTKENIGDVLKFRAACFTDLAAVRSRYVFHQRSPI
jgi:hypothetical protein